MFFWAGNRRRFSETFSWPLFPETAQRKKEKNNQQIAITDKYETDLSLKIRAPPYRLIILAQSRLR